MQVDDCWEKNKITKNIFKMLHGYQYDCYFQKKHCLEYYTLHIWKMVTYLFEIVIILKIDLISMWLSLLHNH